jgi:transcription antitermination factor NusG
VIRGNTVLAPATSCARRFDATEERSAAAPCAGDWYAVQVKRNNEHRVVRHLALRGVATFLPLIEALRRRGRGAARLEPLFSGYLFVQLPALDRDPGPWHIARWTPGVRRILGAEHTVPMPAEAMEVIRARVQPLGFVRPGARFTSGTRVRIESGPLAGLEAIFDRPISREGRVLVLLELLGQVRRAELDEASLDAA